MSLRLRVAVLTAVVTGVALTAAGVTLVTVVEREAREDLDARLVEDFEDAATRATVRVVLQNLRDESIDPNTSTVAFSFTGRVFAQGEKLAESADVPDISVDPVRPGFSTVDDPDGETWRVLTRRSDITVENFADQGPLAIQVMIPTAETEATIADVRRTAQRLGLVGIGAVAVTAWVVATIGLRPLRRLADEAAAVSTTGDLDRRVTETGPRETRAVARSLNDLLRRIGRAAAEREEALGTARSFAADVGHELRTPLTSMATDLDVLAANPDLDDAERASVVRDLSGQHARIVRLLDELRLLARGDLDEAAGTDEVDVVALAETAIDAGRHHHPDVSFELSATPEPTEIVGSAEGLRVLLGNLLDNAATHGRPAEGEPVVRVSVARDGQELVLAVRDEGPGLDTGDLFERFRRGEGAVGDGSGLGLAIVRQQARRHGGDVQMRTAEGGGTEVLVRLPIS